MGSRVASIRLINSVVSLTHEGRFLMYGCSHLSMNCDIFSVMLSQLETMGRIPIGFLWILFRKYSLEVLFDGCFAKFVPWLSEEAVFQ